MLAGAAGADVTLSGPLGLVVVTVVPDRAVGGREVSLEASDTSESSRPMAYISDRSCVKLAPAAAIICGLRGLEDELPFLEC